MNWNSRSEIDTAYTGKCDVALNNRQVLRKKKVEMNDFWTISHSCLICKIVEMKISDNKKWHLIYGFQNIFCLLRVVQCPDNFQLT
jgi:hypothetical protein